VSGSLLNPKVDERRWTRRARLGRRSAAKVAAQPSAADARPDTTASAPAQIALASPDPVAQRVREAGGPTDRASYACQCGYLFAAAVTTTVQCPHCGIAQAW
jgi:hypothetical protein